MTGEADDNGIVWTPTAAQVSAAEVTRFRRDAEERFGRRFGDYETLHRFACDNPELFWGMVWEWSGIRGDPGPRVLENGDDFVAAKFFPDGALNYAENLLRGGEGEGASGDAIALVETGEGIVRREMSRAELSAEVARLAAFLRDAGIVPGDRAAGLLPNGIAAAAAALATASVGAAWSGCSPDFGPDGIAERFGQINPRILFVCDGYFYNGKRHCLSEKIRAVLPRMKSLERIVFVNRSGGAFPKTDVPAYAYADIVSDGGSFGDESRPDFPRFPFNHPLFVLYSSGTTGRPKCIVHGAGGTLIEHTKEHRLHCDLRAGDRLLYYTTCGWMMWNWMLSALASGVSLVLHDGQPTASPTLLEVAKAERVNVLGVSAKYLSALEKAGVRPIAETGAGDAAGLPDLRAVLSTGSPLAAESYDWFYRDFSKRARLHSISGGTDIVACFALGNPALPIRRGEIQCASLGCDAVVFNEGGQAVGDERGELVCRRAIPNKPVGFWRDDDGGKFRAAYFARFPNAWTHGDFAETRPHRDDGFGAHCGMVIHGRSDATLNPGGVRIGTAEIYRQVEKFPEVTEALAVAQPTGDGDERIVLLLKMRDGASLTSELVAAIKSGIRANATPRHVPAVVAAAPDLPRTMNGKLAELAVRRTLRGETIENKNALANPESLDAIRNLPELAR